MGASVRGGDGARYGDGDLQACHVRWGTCVAACMRACMLPARASGPHRSWPHHASGPAAIGNHLVADRTADGTRGPLGRVFPEGMPSYHYLLQPCVTRSSPAIEWPTTHSGPAVLLRHPSTPPPPPQPGTVLVTGTLGLAYPATAATLRRAVSAARGQGATVLVDVNWRPVFWEDTEVGARWGSGGSCGCGCGCG